MRAKTGPWALTAGACAGVVLQGGFAFADGHGIAMYGEPALAGDFAHLPYANPEAPKGGTYAEGEVGSFDSLNPHILRGTTPWQLRFIAYESLMGRSYDEPFTLYGLLAESVRTAEDRSWVEFTLRPEARFSDGSPVTVEDVLWSYETLGTEGHPRYHGLWDKIDGMEAMDERTVRITFAEADRELALLSGLRPILKKSQWQGLDFTRSGLDVVPISTAPYVIEEVDPGRSVTLRRDPDYWGEDVPFMRGQANVDEIRLEFFGNATAWFEAFKAGEVDAFRELSAARWASQYDFPAVTDGRITLQEVPHGRPSGIDGFAMNTRRPVFGDWRVRQAMIEAFPFEFVNETLNDAEAPRITSYFSNSELAMRPGPAEGPVADLLAPYAEDLPPGVLEGYEMPVSDGTERNRSGLRRATALLEEAGHTVEGGAMTTPDGEPFTFEILVESGETGHQAIIDIYVEALEGLGIRPRVSVVDPAQYTERQTAYDYDMIHQQVGVSLSPGNEQYLYWGADGAEAPGTRNLAGIAEPAVDAMIDAIVESETREEFVAATRALDRVLTAGRYVIPLWQPADSRLATWSHLRHPETIPVYGDWIGWLPNVWWSEER